MIGTRESIETEAFREGKILAYRVTCNDMEQTRVTARHPNKWIEQMSKEDFYQPRPGFAYFYKDFIVRQFLVQGQYHLGFSPEELKKLEEMFPSNPDGVKQVALIRLAAIFNSKHLASCVAECSDQGLAALLAAILPWGQIPTDDGVMILFNDIDNEPTTRLQSTHTSWSAMFKYVASRYTPYKSSPPTFSTATKNLSNKMIEVFQTPDNEIYCAISFKAIYFKRNNGGNLGVMPGATMIIFKLDQAMKEPKFKFIALETDIPEIYRLARNEQIPTTEFLKKYTSSRILDPNKVNNEELIKSVKKLLQAEITCIKNVLNECISYEKHLLKVIHAYTPEFSKHTPAQLKTIIEEIIKINNASTSKLAVPAECFEAMQKYAIMSDMVLLLRNPSRKQNGEVLDEFFPMFSAMHGFLAKIRDESYVSYAKSFSHLLGWSTEGEKFTRRIQEAYVHLRESYAAKNTFLERLMPRMP